MSTSTATTKSAKRERLAAATYTISQASDRSQISERQLWRLIDSKKVPGVLRLGRLVRISRPLFDEWLQNGGAK